MDVRLLGKRFGVILKEFQLGYEEGSIEAERFGVILKGTVWTQ